MKELHKYLRENESVLWQSGPKAFPLMESRLKGKILGEWNFSTGTRVLLLVVAAVIILSPVVEWHNLKNQKYFLTDQRAILITADNSLYFMDYNQIDDMAVIDDVADGACIAMGSTILNNVRKQLRWQACHPKTDLQEADKRSEALGMVFYVPEAANRRKSCFFRYTTGPSIQWFCHSVFKTAFMPSAKARWPFSE